MSLYFPLDFPPLSLWLMIQVIFSVAILVQLRLQVTKLVLQHVPDWFP